jgi:hypothetical protein
VSTQILLRRGSSADWAAANPVLATGEPGYDTTTGTFKVGDGVTAWALLASVGGPTAFNARYAPMQRMGAALVTVSQTGITAIADLTGFTVTFNAVAGHVYEVQWLLQVLQNTSASNPLIKLFDSAVDLGFVASFTAAIAQTVMVSGATEVAGLSAGSHTLKLRGSVGAGTIDIINAGVNGRFSVKDLGV